MIGRLYGKIGYLSEDYVLIDVQGVGYIVYCSERTLRSLPAVGEYTFLYTAVYTAVYTAMYSCIYTAIYIYSCTYTAVYTAVPRYRSELYELVIYTTTSRTTSSSTSTSTS